MFNRPHVWIRHLAGLAAVALAASQVLAAEPEVLTQVPGDAYAVVVVNNVRTTGNKISNVINRLNLMAPPDIVGYVTRTIGINKGFDANSSAAIILLKPSADKEAMGYFNGPPPAVLLLPTSDAKAMLEGFTPSDPDKDGISEVTLITDPGKGYVATIAGKWVAFAQYKDNLLAYLGRTTAMNKTLPAETLKVFEENDLVIWGNVAKLGAGLDTSLDAAQTQILDQLDFIRLANNQDPATAAMQRQLWKMIFSGVKQYLKDADTMMLTTRLTDSGISLGMVGGFKPQSPFANFIAAQSKARPVSFAGLPDANFLAAGSISWDPNSIADLVNSVGKQVLSDEAISKSPGAADLSSSFDLIAQMMSLVRNQTVLVTDPPNSGKNGFFHGAILYDTPDPAKLLELQLKLLKSSFASNSMNPDLHQSVEFSPDAVTLKGVKLTKATMKFSLRAETPERPISAENRTAAQLIQAIYGPNGVTMYFGVAGNRLLAIYGSEATTLESAVDAALANADNIGKSPTIAAVKDQIVPNPLAVLYLPVTRWATLAQSILTPPAPGEAPRTPIGSAPPIVISAGVSGNSITGEIHIPVPTIISLRDAYMRLTTPTTLPAPRPILP